MNCDVDFDFAGPTVHGAAVLGYAFRLRKYLLVIFVCGKKGENSLLLNYTP